MIKRSSSQLADVAANSGLHSNLFAMVFERLQVSTRLNVLDMGFASSSTVEFFNQFKCRLNFVDLYAEEFVANPQEDSTDEELVMQFRAALNLDPGLNIDICLFWDFFNYLDGPALKALIAALEPHVGPDTRGYSLGLLNGRASLPYYQYGISSLTNLSQTERGGEQPPIYPHSQRDLNGMLDYFEIDKSRLMPDGRVEYILHKNRSKRPNAGSLF
jgi:hypothetical protein